MIRETLEEIQRLTNGLVRGEGLRKIDDLAFKAIQELDVDVETIIQEWKTVWEVERNNNDLSFADLDKFTAFLEWINQRGLLTQPKPMSDMEEIQRIAQEDGDYDMPKDAGQPKHIEGWQPIETAPKDGTIILACWGNSDNIIDTARYSVVGDYWHDIDKLMNRYLDPTHWQPLPTPPAYNAIMAKEAK